MQETLNKMRKRADDDRGFTLIELLVVVVIIGVLVAIAVPVYLNYRKGAANKSAQSDVRNAISAVEQFYTDNGNTLPVDNDNDGAPGTVVPLNTNPPGSSPQNITTSSGNTLYYHDAGSGVYYICAVNSDGGQVYVYNSGNGGSVAKSSNNVATCATTGS
jgi:type IV pilus assembly protein PilA